MSINHFFSQDQHHHPEAHWWSHYTSMDSPKASSSSSLSSHPHPGPPHISSSSSHNSTTPFWLHPSSAAAAPMNAFDLNNEDDDDEHASQTPACRESEQQEEEEIPKERLFEKPLTPSDVGKLNRLVIPKQHAEKHFPLNTTAASGENGLLLGFEDEVGKSWRFRYSYWNSSQSYVLTKGWSRFVKEKRLDAGDIVMFARHSVDTARFFIGWRRRNSQPPVAAGGGWGRLFCSSSTSNSLSFQPLLPHAPLLHAPPPPPPGGVQNQTTTSSGSGNSKRHLRLFGVNLECSHATEDDSEPSTPVSHPQSHHHHPYHQQYYSSNHHHMDISFSGGGADVHRQG